MSPTRQPGLSTPVGTAPCSGTFTPTTYPLGPSPYFQTNLPPFNGSVPPYPIQIDPKVLANLDPNSLASLLANLANPPVELMNQMNTIHITPEQLTQLRCVIRNATNSTGVKQIANQTGIPVNQTQGVQGNYGLPGWGPVGVGTTPYGGTGVNVAIPQATLGGATTPGGVFGIGGMGDAGGGYYGPQIMFQH